MKNFIVVACVWSLLAGGIAAANGGGVAVVKRKVVNIAAAALLGIGATCGAFIGCERAAQMGSNMVRDVDPVESARDAGEPPVYDPSSRLIKFGVIFEEDLLQSFLGAATAVRVFNQMNVSNGIEAPTFEPVPFRIYENSWSDVVKAANYSIEYDQVVAILGPNSSLLAEFSDEVAQTSGVPMLAIGSTSPGVPRAGDMVFLTAFSDNYQGSVLAAFARGDLNADSAAVLFRSDNNYSEEIAQSFRDDFREMGGVVSSYHGYTYAENDGMLRSQLSSVVEEIARSQPDVVAIPSFVADSAVVMRELRKAGVEAIFIGSDSWSGGLVDSMDERDLVAAAGAAVEGAYYPTHFFFAEQGEDNLSQQATVFVQAYRQLWKRYSVGPHAYAPDALAALGYDAAMILQQAALRVVSDGGKLTRQALRDEIERVKDYRGATDIAGYDDQRLPNKNVIILTIKNGEEMFHKNIRP